MMDQALMFGAPVFGAVLVILGAVLPFKLSARLSEKDGELSLISASAAGAPVPRRGEACDSDAGDTPDVDDFSERDARLDLNFAATLAEAQATLGSSLADVGAEARAAHDRAIQEAEADAQRAAALADEERLGFAAEHLRRQRELEDNAVAEEARAGAEARARRWYVRLDSDMEAPTIEERMALASWLATPAPFAAKLLVTAFEQEDVPRVRARIVGALAGGEHFENPVPFQIAYDNGGIEKAAVLEVLAPRRSTLNWADELLSTALRPTQDDKR